MALVLAGVYAGGHSENNIGSWQSGDCASCDFPPRSPLSSSSLQLSPSSLHLRITAHWKQNRQIRSISFLLSFETKPLHPVFSPEHLHQNGDNSDILLAANPSPTWRGHLWYYYSDYVHPHFYRQTVGCGLSFYRSQHDISPHPARPRLPADQEKAGRWKYD